MRNESPGATCATGTPTAEASSSQMLSTVRSGEAAWAGTTTFGMHTNRRSSNENSGTADRFEVFAGRCIIDILAASHGLSARKGRVTNLCLQGEQDHKEKREVEGRNSRVFARLCHVRAGFGVSARIFSGGFAPVFWGRHAPVKTCGPPAPRGDRSENTHGHHSTSWPGKTTQARHMSSTTSRDSKALMHDTLIGEMSLRERDHPA
jgi:hypothetical protein